MLGLTATPAAASPRDELGPRLEERVIPLRPEEAKGYPANPAPLLPPLRQDLDQLALAHRPDGRYRVRLKSAAARGTSVCAVLDLRPFIPRVPRLARGNATLTRIALSQRELNRHETRVAPMDGQPEVRVANNCLRQGLWEVALVERPAAGPALSYHGWFDFPADEYARLFQEVNGTRYAEHQALLAAYPTLSGVPVPLDALRRVVRTDAPSTVTTHAGEPPARFNEQERKARLLVVPATRYADFTDPARQPIVTARFTEPGFYDPLDPVRFELAWVGRPTGLTWRTVEGIAAPVGLTEIEVRFANGYRLLVADAGLDQLPARTAPPTTEGEVLRLFFGIGTPDITGGEKERLAEFAADRPRYLLLVDDKGRYVDNHTAGIDGVYAWREAGSPGEVHLLLVGYERIAIVAHVSARWNAR